MRILAIANQKGGCGKTTTSINFSASLALLHKKTLLIDMDPQGHSTCGLGLDGRECPKTIYDLLTPREGPRPSFDDVRRSVGRNLDLVPSYEILNALEEELVHVPAKEKALHQALIQLEKSHPDYDYVILDCPPNLGVLTYNALEAADEVLIPVEPSFFSLHGLAKISETIESINQRRLDRLDIHAFLTLFNSRTRFAKEVYEEVKRYFQARLFKTIIHESVALKEAAGAGKSIVDYDPKSLGFRDYFNLAVEYLEREWDRRLPEESLGWENIAKNKYGPRRVVGGVLFQAFNRGAQSVEIVGDFNQWVPEPLFSREPPGLWQKVLCLPQGAYRYKLIVDGEWQMDPCQSLQRANAFGTYDSYLEIH